MFDPDFQRPFPTRFLFGAQHDACGNVVIARNIDQSHSFGIPLQCLLTGFLRPVGRAAFGHQGLRDYLDNVLCDEGVTMFLCMANDGFAGHAASELRRAVQIIFSCIAPGNGFFGDDFKRWLESRLTQPDMTRGSA